MVSNSENDGEIYIVDTEKESGKTTRVRVIHNEGETPHDDCDKTAAFVQPTGLCIERDSLYLTDTGAGALKLISPLNQFLIS